MIQKLYQNICVVCFAFAMTETPVDAQVLGANGDSFISREMPSMNFGTQTALKIKNAAADLTADYDRKAYIRFDLSSIGPLPVATATLTLHGIIGEGIQGTVAGQTIDFSVYGLNDLDGGENWGETTITWNNGPQNDTTSGDGLLSNTTLLGTFSLVGTGIGSTINFGGANLPTLINQDTNNLLTLIITRTLLSG